MTKNHSWLPLVEYCSIGGFFFGVITTAITKQILFSLTPLTFVVFFNTLNRQRLSEQLNSNSSKKQEYIHQVYNDLLSFSDDYKYQKLELERLIDDAKKQVLQLKAIQQSQNQTEIYAILNRISTVEKSYFRIEKFETKVKDIEKILADLQVTINNFEKRISQLEISQRKLMSNSNSSIGESVNLKGLTQFYPLEGLLQRLIKEVKNSTEIQYQQQLNDDKILTASSIKYVQNVAKHSQWLAETVVTYHNDQGCSREEAEKLARELRLLAIEISEVRSLYDLKIIYKIVTLFTYQISRFKHRKSKYCWNYSMRHEMLNVLNDCISKTVQ